MVCLVVTTEITVEIVRKKDFSQLEEGGNATELDVVLRSHFVKHWKNGKFDVVTTEMTTEIIKLEI